MRVAGRLLLLVGVGKVSPWEGWVAVALASVFLLVAILCVGVLLVLRLLLSCAAFGGPL